MAFEYCCFINYPWGPKPQLLRGARRNESASERAMFMIVNDFVQGLQREISLQDRRPIWFDRSRLEPGNLLDTAIGQGICKSACMIMFFTKLYFDEEHPYPARELKAMQDIEEQRMKYLNDKSSGLIIPVILRNPEKFPEVMKNRLHYDFSAYALNQYPSAGLRKKYSAQIKEIADYILKRCESLEASASSIQQNCDQFCLPSVEAAQTFVQTVLGKRMEKVQESFPTRTTASTAEVIQS